MALTFPLLVAAEDLDRVGPYGFFNPETRLVVRLQNVDGVSRVDPLPGPIRIGNQLNHVFMIERKAGRSNTEIDLYPIKRSVMDAVDKFLQLAPSGIN